MADGVEYSVRAVLEAKGRRETQKRFAAYGKHLSAIGSQMQGVGNAANRMGARISGSLLATSAATTKIATGLAAVAGAYGMGRLVTSSIAVNEQWETLQGTIASTYQLMGGFGGSFSADLKLAGREMLALERIAAASPASMLQAKQLYTSMLPGASAVSKDLDRIRKLTSDSLSLGLIMGGDFQTTGAQLSRMLTGSAGAEFETWKVMQTPILEAGKALGIFNERMQIGQKLTQEFNELSGEQRMQLVEAAANRLGDATEHFGQTYRGLKSTLESSTMLLQKSFGSAVFETVRSRMQTLAKTLAPQSETFGRLEQAAGTWGIMLAEPLSRALDWGISGLEHVSRNWLSISEQMLKAGQIGLKAAEVGLKVAVMRAGVGAGMQAGGAAVSGLGGIASGMLTLVSAGPAAAAAMLALGAAVGGIAVVGGGVFVHLADNWKDLVKAFRSGEITLRPLGDAIAELWAKLSAAGGAFLGSGSAASQAQRMVDLATNSVISLTEAMSHMLRVGGWTTLILENITHGVLTGVGLIGMAFTSLIRGIMDVIAGATSWIPKVGDATARAAVSVANFDAKMWDFTKNSAKRMGFEGTIGSRMLAASDAFDDAVGRLSMGHDPIAQLHAAMVKSDADRLNKALFSADADARERTNRIAENSAPTNHFHNARFNIKQDLRGSDPDRVIAAFKKDVSRATMFPTGGTTVG